MTGDELPDLGDMPTLEDIAEEYAHRQFYWLSFRLVAVDAGIDRLLIGEGDRQREGVQDRRVHRGVRRPAHGVRGGPAMPLLQCRATCPNWLARTSAPTRVGWRSGSRSCCDSQVDW
jgi:hypothetical protein